jgi:hypothetical protein
MDQDDWSAMSMNAYTCGYILLAKAYGLSEGLTGIFEASSDTVKLAKIGLNSN